MAEEKGKAKVVGSIAHLERDNLHQNKITPEWGEVGWVEDAPLYWVQPRRGSHGYRAIASR